MSVTLDVEIRFEDGGWLALTDAQAEELIGRLVRNPSFFGSLSLAAKLRRARSDGGTHGVRATPCEAAALRHAGAIR
jgi:hypothetical protein